MKYILLISLALTVSISSSAQDLSLGKISIKTNVNNHFLIIDEDFDNSIKITNEDTIRVPIGTHKFRLASPFKYDYRFDAEIFEDSLISKKITLYSSSSNPQLSSYPRLHWQANLMINSEEGSEIFIDNQRIGTSFLSSYLNGVLYTILVKNGRHTDSRKVIILPSKLQVVQLSTLPQKKRALMLSAIPGASQFYRDQNIKGVVFSMVFLGLASASIELEHQSSITNKTS